MTKTATALPRDETTPISDFVLDPYAIYQRYRAETPVIEVASVGRVMLTKAADTRMVKENWELFSSDDPNTPMRRAFQAHTLMRKDGQAHARERHAMASAFGAKAIRDVWLPLYQSIAEDYIGRLPRGETVDLFGALAAPISAKCLGHLVGLTQSSDDDLCRWSQVLIDGAGNFGFSDEPFIRSDATNGEINGAIDASIARLKSQPHVNAISAMISAEDPLPLEAIRSNIKIAIGGGINEPRDALCTAVYGLLSNPDQLADAKANPRLWANVFDETVRWVAPIQVSSRLVKEDTEIRGIPIAKNKVVMTIQASANHDEELYDAPHLFDIHRPKQSHQAFGNGPHFCMGTHIARRMIADIVLPMLFDRFPNMRLAGDVPFRGFGFRGPISVPVVLD
ncbi:MAG: cytochrome P450 [Pseudomonadota bacterium]